MPLLCRTIIFQLSGSQRVKVNLCLLTYGFSMVSVNYKTIFEFVSSNLFLFRKLGDTFESEYKIWTHPVLCSVCYVIGKHHIKALKLFAIRSWHTTCLHRDCSLDICKIVSFVNTTSSNGLFRVGPLSLLTKG